MSLQGKRILLGVTGGIAAYKACELLRLLVKASADVEGMMTKAAAQFVGPLTIETLSGKPVAEDLWDPKMRLPHISLRKNKDLIVIAPATANIIAKAANGIADDLVSSTLLARECPLMLCPAMNVQMWRNAATVRNIQTLKGDGVLFSGPEAGSQACGDVGEGRLREPVQILEDIEAFFTPPILSGKKVLMTAGPTFEPFDPVRGITNGSSGRQAAAIAAAAVRAGAEVTIVSGPVAVPYPDKAAVIPVQQAQEMFKAVKNELAEHTPDAFIGVAAVGDWRPAEYSESKLKKEKDQDTLTIKLVKNPDILSYVGHSGICSVVIGFAAETDNLAENARKKLDCKAADMIVVNPASAIGSAQNQASFVTKDGIVVKGRSSKAELAEEIIETLADLLKKKEIETYETSN